MNLITTNALTMSSREIAELVEARHNDVIATIERLFDKGLLRSSRKSRREATGGRPIEVYDLIERDTHLVIAGYSDEHRARVIDRWQELERKLGARPPMPQSLPEALRFAADLAEQKAVLALENQQQAAKIESLENFFMAGETPFQFVKRLNGVNCSLISHALMELGWVFNDADPESRPHYRVYSRTREKKWLTEKPRQIKGEGASTFTRYDLVLLIDGAKKLHDLYMSQKLPMKKTWDGQFSCIKFTPETSL